MSQEIKTRIRRFTLPQRLFHLFLMGSFLFQGATGLARMYMETQWGQQLCAVFGGYDHTRTLHIYVGVFMLCGFVIHTLYMLVKIDWRRFPKSLFGPDSLIPHPRDIVQFFQHLGWMLGFKKPPQFDRWGYWEKFDYWAVFWGMVIIGTTGLLLAFPFSASRIMPGWGLNVAFWVHRIEAVLALAHVFIIHFFIAHLRRHNFPMDRTMFEGSADLDTIREERPSWIGRLEHDGRLAQQIVAPANAGVKAFHYVIGYAAILLGLYLLIGALVNIPNVSW